MSSEDGHRPGSPAGGWLPPPQHFAPPAVPPAPPVPTVVVASRRPVLAPGRARAVLIAAGVVTALAVTGVAVSSGDDPVAAPIFVLLPELPGVPLPSGAPATDPPARTEPLATTPVRGRPAAPRGGAPVAGRPSPGASSATATPAAPVFVIDAAVGLQPAGDPSRRVRHYDFRARIDVIGPDSPALAKADARFTVRTGRAGRGCVSFESANYPGRFLRDAGTEIRLDAPGGRRYDAEATFCAVPVRGGFVLRGQAAPDRYLTRSDTGLSLQRVPADRAQVFVTRRPY